MISVELSVISGKHSGQVIRLDRKKFLIGREQDCHLRPNSELVSRHHCVFTVDDFSVRLRDLGSTNGTVVNGERIRKETVLQPGDHVIVGSLEFKVKINETHANDSVEKSTGGDTTPEGEAMAAGSETRSEMPPVIPDAVVPEQSVAPTPPTGIPAIPVAPAQTMPGSLGDTTVISQPIMMPGQMPYQPMMPQMGGYPMYGNYPYPGMPQQMPMYQQPYPNQMPMQGYEPQPVAEPIEVAPSGTANVSLPDPMQTGLKVDPPKPVESSEATAESNAKAAEKSNATAAAIIQKHMQRRPGG